MACHRVMRGEAMFPQLEVKTKYSSRSQVGRDGRASSIYALIRINVSKKLYFLQEGNFYKNQNM